MKAHLWTIAVVAATTVAAKPPHVVFFLASVVQEVRANLNRKISKLTQPRLEQ